MTPTPQPAEEAELCQAYQKETTNYLRALAEMETVLEAFRQGRHADEAIQRLTVLLEEVASIEESIALAKRRWSDRGGKPGPELRAVLTSLAQILERLLERIGEAERHAWAQQKQLLPELVHLAQGRRMQRAYKPFQS